MNSRGIFAVLILLLVGGVMASRMKAKAPATTADSVEQKDVEVLSSPSPTPALSSPIPKQPSKVAQVEPAVDPKLAIEFSGATVAALASIPSVRDLRKLQGEQLHFTPPAVIEAASAIGHVSELVEANPALSSKGLDFYRTCAEKSEAPESLQATCLADFKKLRIKSGLSAAEPKVSKRVAAFADKIAP